ncbi:MAG: LPS export ABC transporter permease LptF [Steroidobacteraceae bacterium]
MPGDILFRHVLREVAFAVFAVAIVLLVLLITNQIAFTLGRAAEGKIPASLVFELVGLSVRQYSTVILPVALMLGIVTALGRLYHDSELVAAQACGAGPKLLFGPTAVVAVALSLLCGWIALNSAPIASQRVLDIRADALRTAATRGLTAGRFRSLGSGAVLYFQDVDADGVLHNVFFQRRGRDPLRIEVIVAERAQYALASDASAYTVTLYNGESYEGVPGQGAWRRVKFRYQIVPVRTPEGDAGSLRTEAVPTRTLFASNDPRLLAELHWRYSSPLMVLILAALAVPLARLRPRQGRYSRIALAIVVYAVYANLLIAGRTWLERGVTPEWLGLWWVHAFVALLGLAIVFGPQLRARARYFRYLSSQPSTS